ncbi:hypothetical protein BC939DRAFT_524388 [Gamsiella multidivaricata]|uniref:uncharacterized protein n=1 Tax=Gamsiella multidivaricata TaxID=101098 RepID=UPI00221E4423|nr:uncharacterized protein BC939DRAFT_524388 [Gamsiella multidivaricata]KAI7832766.1 hypothetical protein BC939DRAFT_524388 [Gamsiella multidivaricata]
MPPKHSQEAAHDLRPRKRVDSKSLYARLKPFVEFFKDPPNVDGLTNSVRPPCNAASASLGPEASRGGGEEAPYHLLQLEFSGSDSLCEANRPRVFLETLYLSDRIRQRMRNNFDKVNLMKGGNTFKDIASELDQTEPELQGVTGVALADLWQPTKFSDVANEIVALVDDIQEAKGRKTAAKEGKQVEEVSRAARATRALFATTSRSFLPSQPSALSAPSASTSSAPSSMHLAPSSSSSSPPSSSMGPTTLATASLLSSDSFEPITSTATSPLASTDILVAPLATTRSSTTLHSNRGSNAVSNVTRFLSLSSATE